VVTSRRAPERRSDVPQRIDVVTRADLEATAANDVTDALKRNEALDVIEYPGLLSGVSLRGFRPQFSGISPRTLILLDGRPAGATNLSTIDVSAIERIEVMKGPASALYGSSAMGGVINLVTRRSSGPLHGTATAGYGSFQSYRGQLATGGTVAGPVDFDLSLAAAGRGDDFHTGSRRLLGGASVPKTLPGGETVRVPELVGDTTLPFTEYATRSGSLRLGAALGGGWRAEARGGYFAGDHVQNPGDLNSPYPFPTLNDLSRRTGEVSLSGGAGAHSLSLRAYAAREVTSYWDDAAAPSFVSSRTPVSWRGVQLQDVVRLGAHSLTAGLDYQRAAESSEVRSAPGTPAPPYSPGSSVRSAAAFAETALHLLDDRLVATLGGRLDDVRFRVASAELYDGTVVSASEEGHTVFNPSAGLLLRPGAGLRLHASAGRAFVNPDAFYVAGYSEQPASGSPGSVVVTRGNPALRPEHSTSWDAGAGLSRPALGLELDLTWFHTDVRDRIAFRPLPVEGVRLTAGGDTIVGLGTYTNADRAAIRGLEASASWDVGALSGFDRSVRLFAGATRFLRAEETVGGVTTDIRNVADLTAVAGVEYDDLRRFSARLSGRYVGERLDTDFSDFTRPGDVRYPEFLVFDLAATLRLSERYRLGVTVANLGDENYYEVRGYNLPGRSLQLSLGVAF
jgi:outer membrane receptor protein involved in Fe transport